jgi:shikimate dehydrogenase
MASTRPTLCGSIAGHPGRLGHAMHSAAYRALGLDFVYVAFGTEDTAGAVAAMRALGIRGLGVTTPHKRRIAPLLDRLDDAARAIGAVNTVVNDEGRLSGYNVDWIGAQRALQEVTALPGRRAVLLGAGGGARAVAYGLLRAGAEVTVLNRSEDAGREMASALGARFGGPPAALGGLDYDIVAHATTVGFRDPAASLVPQHAIRRGAVAFDTVADPPRTRFLADAEARGCTTVRGVRMQLHQATAQFALYTGRTPDLAVMEDALRAALGTG